MKFDLSGAKIGDRAFSDQPMRFVDPGTKKFLSDIIDLVALETGNKVARENWQQKQIQNLLHHAASRSNFWRKRIGARKINDIKLSDLPILTRSEVIEQTTGEGSLINPQAGLRVKQHSTSGSSGKPVQFYASEMNASYNAIRTVAQYFVEGLPLQDNVTQFSFSNRPGLQGFSVTRNDSWCGVLNPLFSTGKLKKIEYRNPDMNLLRQELKSDSIGYLICAPWTVETLTQDLDVEELKSAGLKMWIALSESPSQELRDKFVSSGIPVRTNYSSEETGVIGWECEATPLNYHIVTSNVVVEVAEEEGLRIGAEKVGSVLVTHLHSYATPFIRYDIGDLGTLNKSCVCGHDGPTLTNLHGRTKSLIKHKDGRISPFYLNTAQIDVRKKIAEYRIRQTDLGTLVVEIVGKPDITPDDVASFQNQIKRIAGDDFSIDLRLVESIDWGTSRKRLGFRCDVL